MNKNKLMFNYFPDVPGVTLEEGEYYYWRDFFSVDKLWENVKSPNLPLNILKFRTEVVIHADPKTLVEDGDGPPAAKRIKSDPWKPPSRYSKPTIFNEKGKPNMYFHVGKSVLAIEKSILASKYLTL